MFYVLEPEVAGGLGEQSVLDHSVQPAAVLRLHYEFEDWFGDDILETTPCFIVTQRLRNAIVKAKFTGYICDDVIVTKSVEFQEAKPRTKLPKFFWLKVSGKAGKDDFGMSRDRTLVVSERGLDLMKTFSIKNCWVRPFE